MAEAAVVAISDGSKTLGSRVYDRLRDDIVRGELAPGMKLTLETLKQRYDVGITPLREALYRLSTSQLVVAVDQRGFCVASVSEEHRADIFAARQHIETLVIEDAMKHGDVAWESRILSAFHQLERTPMYMSDGRMLTREWEVAHRGFHEAIWSAAKSATLLHFQSMLWDHAARYRNLKTPPTVQPTLSEEHSALVVAVLSRDVELARLLLKRHILGRAAVPLKAMRHLGILADSSTGE